MEVTNGLLSNLVHTRAIESVLAPIASQISLLIILDESGDDEAGPCQMGPCAETVMKAAASLIEVGKERAKHSRDQDYVKQMLSACEILDLASSNLYIASQRLESNNSKESRGKIVSAAKDVLQGTMKVLLVSDDAEVRKIVSAAHLVTENVQRLGEVKSMTELLAQFKSFTDSTSLLGTLVNRRQKELCHERQREKVILSMSVLQKCIPSMSVALQSYIKYPHNPQAQVSKSYVTNQILSAIRELIEAIENMFTEEDSLEDEGPGFFVTKIDQLLEALEVEKRSELRRDLDVWSEAVVRHSMLVAHLSKDHNRDIIIKACQRILQLKTKVIRLFYATLENSELEAVRSDYDMNCEMLADEFCELEKSVNMTLLNLVVDVFKESSEPLERLVKASMADLEVSATDRFSDFVSEFEDHAEKMCQVGNLAAASSTDAQRVRIIRTCVYRLEKLDPDMIPATVAMTKHPEDKMAVKHVKLLMKEWSFELSKLLQALDEMIDPNIFMQISVKKIEEDVITCRGFLTTRDSVGMASVINSMIGRGKRVCQMAERIISSHSDPLYRNGLLVYVRQLQKVIPGVKVAGANLLDSLDNPNFLQTLEHRWSQLLDRVAQVRDGLSEENQPSILSEQRRNIRQSAMCNIKPRITKSTSHSVVPVQKKSPLYTNIQSQSAPHLRTLPIVPQSLAATYHAMYSIPKSSTEKPIQATSSLNLHSKVESLPKETIISDLSTGSGILTKRLLESVSAHSRGATDIIIGEMLGWSNHIEEAGHAVSPYASTTKERTMMELCNSVHDLMSKISTQSGVQGSDFNQQCHQWSSKIEKLRMFVDTMISEQKAISDKLYDVIVSKSQKQITLQVKELQEHQKCLFEIVQLTEEWQGSDVPSCIGASSISRLKENGEELDSITVTMVTTTEMISSSEDDFEMSQLDQLGRDWAVRAFLIVKDLNNVIEKCHQRGQERSVWPWSREQNKHEDWMLFIDQENAIYKRLLHCSCMGHEKKSKIGQDVCVAMNDVQEMIKTAVAMETKDEKTVPLTYIPLKMSVLTSIWIVKAIEALELINSQTEPYSLPANALVQKAMSASERGTSLSTTELNTQISQFSENLVKMRQKTLSGIQLSTEIEGRSMVRKCLDQLTEQSPKMIQSLKDYAGGVNDVTLDNVNRVSLEWSVKARQLLFLLQQLKDIRPTMATDMGRLLGISVPDVTMEALDYSDTLAGNALPSGSLPPETSRQSYVCPRDAMHSELLKTTKSRIVEIGQIPKPNPRKKKTESPYKPTSSILDAAKYLHQEAEKWEDECNPVVQVAMAMSNQMQLMYACCRRKEETESQDEEKNEMSSLSLAIAENGEKMRQFARILAKYCTDRRCSSDLELQSSQIQVYCKQLSILANVQMSSSRDVQRDKILIRNAENLMKVVKQTMRAAEAACVKGVDAPEYSTEDEAYAIILATQWKRKLDKHRLEELSVPERDELGLRRIERDTAPQLSHIFNRKF